MTQAQLGLLIGGIIPAFLFGFAGICQKWSSNQGVPLGIHLFCIGFSVMVIGILLHFFTPSEAPFRLASTIPSFLLGLTWGIGSCGIIYAIIKYSSPLAKLVPLYNMNTLITVVLALFIFKEWQEVNLLKLSIGTLAIIIGGILIST